MTAAHCTCDGEFCGAWDECREWAALQLVSADKRCIVHDQSYTRVCTGCAADRLAGEEAS